LENSRSPSDAVGADELDTWVLPTSLMYFSTDQPKA